MGLAFTTVQPIIGVDMHLSVPPIPAFILPHYVVWGTGLSLSWHLPLSETASKAMSLDHPAHLKNPIAVGFGHATARGHDAGPHWGHIAGNTLLPIIGFGAASKAEFGSATVLVQKSMPIAVNLGYFMNPQLHCHDPLPLPSGLSFATGSNQVLVGFTWLDVFAGVVHMLIDIAISALLNVIMGAGTNFIGAQVAKLLKRGPGLSLLTALKEGFVGVGETLDDIFVRKLSSGKRVMDWDRLTPRGFKQQIVAAREVFRDVSGALIPAGKQAARTARDTALSLVVGGPTGADLDVDPNDEYGIDPPGSVAGNKANEIADELIY